MKTWMKNKNKCEKVTSGKKELRGVVDRVGE